MDDPPPQLLSNLQQQQQQAKSSPPCNETIKDTSKHHGLVSATAQGPALAPQHKDQHCKC
jgi:hypothetical protein